MRAPIHRQVTMRALGALVLATIACSGARTNAPRNQALSFVADAPSPGEEAYVCFGFDAAPFAATTVQSIRWRPPSGPVVLHHATLFALVDDAPDGPWSCIDMPNAVGLHIFAPGSGDLVLGDDVGLLLPSGTRRFVVQAHVLRMAAGDANEASVTITASPHPPTHVAAWMSALAPVPAIRPHHVELSRSSCALAADLHVLAAWPHMHRIGAEISASIVDASGAATSIVDVSPWNFGAQRTYAISLDARAGDEVQIECRWDNATSEYVLPGLGSSQEMCTFSMLVWPADAAHWQRACW